MDLVFEFAHAFGPIRPRKDSWQYFLAGVERTGRFTARQIYAAIVGPSFALSGLSSENAGQRMQVQHLLEKTAFGLDRPLIQMVES